MTRSPTSSDMRAAFPAIAWKAVYLYRETQCRKLLWVSSVFSPGHKAGQRSGPRPGSQAPLNPNCIFPTGSKTGIPTLQPELGWAQAGCEGMQT